MFPRPLPLCRALEVHTFVDARVVFLAGILVMLFRAVLLGGETPEEVCYFFAFTGALAGAPDLAPSLPARRIVRLNWPPLAPAHPVAPGLVIGPEEPTC